MSDKKDELKVKFLPLANSYLMASLVPQRMVDSLNSYLDKLQEDKNRKSHAKSLVGQIKRGQQLSMKAADPEVKEFAEWCCTLSLGYIDLFSKSTGTNFSKLASEVNEIWSVHSYEGDYNPIHAHGVKSVTGVSCTTWTKIPKQIEDVPGEIVNNLFNASGNCDGFITFYHGATGGSRQDAELLRPPQHVTLKPLVGTMYFFPSWMQHSVYPFFGEGERRTVAANMNIWPEEVLNATQHQFIENEKKDGKKNS